MATVRRSRKSFRTPLLGEGLQSQPVVRKQTLRSAVTGVPFSGAVERFHLGFETLSSSLETRRFSRTQFLSEFSLPSQRKLLAPEILVDARSPSWKLSTSPQLAPSPGAVNRTSLIGEGVAAPVVCRIRVTKSPWPNPNDLRGKSRKGYLQHSGSRVAVHYSILTSVQTVIRSLNLENITSDQVYVRKLPTDRNLTLPCVIISHGAESELDVGGTTSEDDWGYPVLVSTVQPTNQELTADNESLLWRQQIRDAFHQQRLSGVPTVLIGIVEPRPIIDVGLWQQNNLDVGTLLIRFVSREQVR